MTPEEILNIKAGLLAAWHAGETPGPWHVDVFPTNRCNLKCTICWQRWAEAEFGKLDHSQELSDERLLRLVDECADLGVADWNIGGGGEPWVRRQLVMDMCTRIRARGMNGGIFSNGVLYDEERLRNLIEIGWERLDFSLDGPTAEINDAIRSEGAFEGATANMRLLSQLRREAGVDRPIMDIHMVLTRLNVGRMDDMIRMAHELGHARFGVSALQAQSGQSTELALTEEQQTALPELMAKATALSRELGVETNTWSPDNIKTRDLRHAPKNPMEDEFLGASCYEPWLTATILPQGYVGPCCTFWDEDAETLHDHSLAEVWTGPYLQRFRESSVSGDLPGFCQWCPSHYVWQTEELRKRLRARVEARASQERTVPQRMAYNLRRYGILGTGRRACQWLQIKLRRHST